MMKICCRKVKLLLGYCLLICKREECPQGSGTLRSGPPALAGPSEKEKKLPKREMPQCFSSNPRDCPGNSFGGFLRVFWMVWEAESLNAENLTLCDRETIQI